jgi:hypothetical protein
MLDANPAATVARRRSLSPFFQHWTAWCPGAGGGDKSRADGASEKQSAQSQLWQTHQQRDSAVLQRFCDLTPFRGQRRRDVRFYRSSSTVPVCYVVSGVENGGQKTLAEDVGSALVWCSAQDTPIAEASPGCFNQPPTAQRHSGRLCSSAVLNIGLLASAIPALMHTMRMGVLSAVPSCPDAVVAQCEFVVALWQTQPLSGEAPS